MNTGTANIRIAADIAARYDELARSIGQSRDQLVADVLSAYIEQAAAERERTRNGIAEADRGEFASDEEMEAFFAQYGGPNRASLRVQSARELYEAQGLLRCK